MQLAAAYRSDDIPAAASASRPPPLTRALPVLVESRIDELMPTVLDAKALPAGRPARDRTVAIRTHTASVAVILSLLAAACGGSSQSQEQKFKAGYEKLRGPANKTGRALGAELKAAPGQTDAQVAAAFRGLASRFQGQVSQLETLKPPSNLAADWNSVLGSANRIEADLRSMVAAAAAHSRSAAEQAGADLATNAGSLKSATTTIKSKLGIK